MVIDKTLIKILGFSAASFAVGAYSAWYFTTKKLEKFYENQIDLEIAAALVLKDDGVKVTKLYQEVAGRHERSGDEGPPPATRVEVIVPERLPDGRIPYHKIARREEIRVEIADGVMSTPEPIDPMENAIDAEEQARMSHNQALEAGNLPFVIPEDACGEIDGYSKVSASYYPVDGVLYDGYDVLDISEEVGEENIKLFGWLSEENVLHIRNNQLQSDLEIVNRPDESYAYEVLGIDNPGN